MFCESRQKSLSALQQWFFFFNFIYLYLFMAVLSLRFCARAFSNCGKRGPLLIAVRGPLAIAASLVAEHRLQTRKLSNCGSRAQPLRGMWDPPRPGSNPCPPHWQADSQPLHHQGSPSNGFNTVNPHDTFSSKNKTAFNVSATFHTFQVFVHQ